MPERTPDHPTHSRSDGRIRPSANEKSSPTIPKTGKPTTAQEIKSFVRKNLLASPEFPRLYADVVISSAPNSPEAKILARNYKKICERVNQQIHKEKSQMSTCKSCTHIKVTGVGCGSPALRGEQFCYFHQRMLRTVKYPRSRISHNALLEDEESIQVSLMETVDGLLCGTIELKRAELILRALNTAVRNIRRVKFGVDASKMVTDVPDFATPPTDRVDEAEAPRHRLTREEVARNHAANLAEYFGGADKVPDAIAATSASSTLQVKTDAFVRPIHVETPAPSDSRANGSKSRPSAVEQTSSCEDKSSLCGDGSKLVPSTAEGTRPGGPEVLGRSTAPSKPAAQPEFPVRKPAQGVKKLLRKKRA